MSLKALEIAEKYMPDIKEVTKENYPENNESIVMEIEFVKKTLFDNGIVIK